MADRERGLSVGECAIRGGDGAFDGIHGGLDDGDNVIEDGDGVIEDGDGAIEDDDIAIPGTVAGSRSERFDNMDENDVAQRHANDVHGVVVGKPNVGAASPNARCGV